MKNIIVWLSVFALCIASAGASYSTSDNFLDSNEWENCQIATDWCNSFSIVDNELGAWTLMYCDDVYWPGKTKQWSCLDDTLEEERIWFLSKDDLNRYKVFQKNIWEQMSGKIVIVVNKFGEKILQAKKYNTMKSLINLRNIQEQLEVKITNLVKSYPANYWMSKEDTRTYYKYQALLMELKILDHKWNESL